MSISCALIAFRSPDDLRLKKMKEIWERCSEMKVSIPKEVDDYFCGMTPSDFVAEAMETIVAADWHDKNEHQKMKVEVLDENEDRWTAKIAIKDLPEGTTHVGIRVSM